MRPLLPFFSFSLLIFMVSACSSLDGDAKEAAKLSKKSIEYCSKMKFDKAKEAYEEARAIFRKYEKAGEKEKFATAYQKYLTKE